MSKKLLFLAFSLLTLIFSPGGSQAQTDPDLFALPDTVCTGHEIIPTYVIDGAQSYDWSFCPASLGSVPEGINAGFITSVNDSRGIIISKDEGINYTFNVNGTGSVVRMRYLDGLEGAPSMITSIGSGLNNPSGLFMVHEDARWHLFVLAGTDTTNARLLRYDFLVPGLKSMPEEVNLGNLGGMLDGPKHLFIAKDGDNWYGFTFNKNDELLRLAFGENLLSTPTVTNMGNIDGHFNGVSAITGIIEIDNWHLFITNRTGNSINRISFGNALSNTPYVIDLGNLNNRISFPVGIAVTKDCDDYFGYVLNYGTASITTLHWVDSSIAITPLASVQGNVADFEEPLVMSNLIRDSGSVYLFAHNLDNTLSKVMFHPCEDATPAGSSEQFPGFKFGESGLRTVFLVTNEGLPNMKTDCEQIYIFDNPPITISNDTMICQGDTIRLSLLTTEADSLKWVPDYNISNTDQPFVDIHPEYTTQYVATAYYAPNCIVANPINVTVSKVKADAGEDRILSDGSTTILGGPETTLGTQYTYEWEPNIGHVHATDEPVTRVKPPYDITYYLKVTNSEGCWDLDSVLVSLPCDNINLPNAFRPGSNYEHSNGFGLLNLQLIKINYFRIYDRWGQEVFSTTDPQGRWDGTIKGQEAPLGVYVWEVDANCANTQERFRRSGTVTLIR